MASFSGEYEPEAVVGWFGQSDVSVTVKKKFALALLAYAALGILAWTTLSNEPIHLLNADISLRQGTLIVLGLFAFRSALYYWRTRIEDQQASAKLSD
jgi:hypothetical protein